ncbi:hypothetical protein ACTXT7_003641 [Hymenolepis weldensis]
MATFIKSCSPKKTSKRDGKGLIKHRKAFRWGSRQVTDKGEVSTPSSEDDVDNTDRSKQSSSTPVPQKDPYSDLLQNLIPLWYHFHLHQDEFADLRPPRDRPNFALLVGKQMGNGYE